MKGFLLLEDGTIFEGSVFGAKKESYGEVVFNTGMTGYQEILSDPSYCGQIVTMTYPLIGNYGINAEDFESKKPYVRGFVVKEFCSHPSNWRSELTVDQFFEEHGIMGLSGIDTRALTKKLRSQGALRGCLTIDTQLVEQHKQGQLEFPQVFGPDLVATVTTTELRNLPNNGKRVVVIDFGAKENIIRSLHSLGFEVIVMPATASFSDILAQQPDGIMLSNGPGDPTDVPQAIETVKQLLGVKPMFGICLGHQIIGLALGGQTYKLKFGHRGANHPVKDLRTNRVYITSQNHGFALAADSLQDKDIEITHINLNDNTVEGLAHKQLPVFSVQYHPEAAPGPEDNYYLFERFKQMME